MEFHLPQIAYNLYRDENVTNASTTSGGRFRDQCFGPAKEAQNQGIVGLEISGADCLYPHELGYLVAAYVPDHDAVLKTYALGQRITFLRHLLVPQVIHCA